MKKITLIAAVVMAAFSTNAVAQQEATANVATNAKIITPISVTGTTPMEFGVLAVDAGTASSVIVAADNTTSTTGNVTISATSNPTAAQFTVTGESGYEYTLNVAAPFEISETTDDTKKLTVTPSTPVSANQSKIGTGGTDVVSIGATLDIPAGQATGTYFSDTGFSVTVYYN